MELPLEELGVFDIIAQVGAPIAAALFMGGFIFLIIRKIMDDVVGDTEEVKRYFQNVNNSYQSDEQ